MILALNSQTNGRKQNRYKTFGILLILFRPNEALGVISKRFWGQILHDNPEFTNVSFTVDRQGYVLMCFSSKQNGNHLYEMHEGDIIFSANQGDSWMKDEDLQAIEIKDAYGEIEYSEEGAGFQIKEKCTKVISIH